MCVIALGSASKILPHLERIWNQNPHGAAFYSFDKENGGNPQENNPIIKTMDFLELSDLIEETGDARVLVHCRYASVGAVNNGAIHGFQTAKGVLFHNGTLNNYPPDTASDTIWLANELVRRNESLEDYLEDGINCENVGIGRFVEIINNFPHTYGRFHEFEGVKYSKMTWNDDYYDTSNNPEAGEHLVHGDIY
jgi:hypothetical protein